MEKLTELDHVQANIKTLQKYIVALGKCRNTSAKDKYQLQVIYQKKLGENQARANELLNSAKVIAQIEVRGAIIYAHQSVYELP